MKRVGERSSSKKGTDRSSRGEKSPNVRSKKGNSTNRSNKSKSESSPAKKKKEVYVVNLTEQEPKISISYAAN